MIQVELMGAELTGLNHYLCLPVTLSHKSNCQWPLVGGHNTF